VIPAAAAAFAAALAAVMIIERRAGALGLIDIPNDRSSHVVPRPRGGGLGVIAGLGVGIAMAAWFGSPIGGDVWTILGASLIVAAIGIWDDLSALTPAPKFAAQIVAAAIVVWNVGGFTELPLPAPLNLALGIAGIPLTVAWLVIVTNFFNFMDGVDGLAGGQAAITFVAIAWAAWPEPSSVVSLLSAAAVVAFLLRNWEPAKIFLGDVGSGWLGFLLAALPLAMPAPDRAPMVLLVATSLTLCIVDPVLTLVRRTLRGHRIGSAHREHAYQQLIAPGRLQSPTVLMLLVGAMSTTVAGALAHRNPSLGWLSIGWAGAVCAIEWAAVKRARRL
jgi:glycosyltransferase WbpL